MWKNDFQIIEKINYEEDLLASYFYCHGKRTPGVFAPLF